jgi:hypothetical protein
MSFVEICFRLWSSALEGYKILKEKYSDNNAMGRTQTFDWFSIQTQENFG